MTEQQLRAQVIAWLEWMAESHIGVEKRIADEALALLKAQGDQAPPAKWLVRRKSRYATCSRCGFSFADVYDMENWDNYCRHCGAKMEGMMCDG